VIADGPPSRVIEEAVAGRVELVLVDLVLDELARVLATKLGFDPDRVRDVEAFLLERASKRLAASTDAPALSGDPADDAILAAASSAQVDAIVTGDKRHLLPLGEHAGVRLLAPQALLATIHEGPSD
jgi:predicted nucleic acid-binding protein